MTLVDQIKKLIDNFNTYGLVSDFFKDVEKTLREYNIDSKDLCISVNEKEIKVSWVDFPFKNFTEIKQKRK